MMTKLVAICYFYFLQVQCSSNFSFKSIQDDDYYPSYDYDLNTSSNFGLKTNPLLLPNPESVESKYTIDVLPNIELPDDSLADTDLKDHDFIDNLMYVYYGSHQTTGRTCGPELIIIGSVLSCAAQLLTIFFILLKNNLNVKKEMKCLFLHLMGSMCFANLLFMLGVYATKNMYKCIAIAFTLHYFHLLTAFWVFLYCYYVYKRISNNNMPTTRFFYSIGYSLPLIFSIVSYLLEPHSFESKHFCFISVQKGMILNYMLPVSGLIIATTVNSLNGIRKINIEMSKLEFSSSAESLNALRNESELEKKFECVDEEVVSLKETKRCLKLLCGVQTVYDIVWFIAVVALENNNESNIMAVVYSVTSCLLNWYIFLKAKSFLPSILNLTNSLENVVLIQDDNKIIIVNGGCAAENSSDNVPLLDNAETTEMKELRLEYISTISS